MTTLSFASKIQVQAGSTLLTGLFEGQKVWYLLRPKTIKLSLLERMIGAGTGVDLSEYGEVIESGWGEPPAAL